MMRAPVVITLVTALVIAVGAACSSRPSEPTKPPPQVVRVAVIGGMTETGFWQELAARFERATGHRVEIAATGPKPVVIDAFRKGNIDLITLHASDAIVNLVADGLAADPQPWVHNDLVIVGPKSDPAGIRGKRDAVAALRKLVAANAKVVVHASLGADGVLHELENNATGTRLTEEHLVVFANQNQHQILAKAAEANAYTLVGRIPVLLGKLAHPEIEVMVRGDVRLRRPYLVAVAKRKTDRVRLEAARELAAFLRSPETQAFIATFGKGKYDDAPLFFPVSS